jgi:arylsulfatase A-like enzyme
MDSLNAVLVVVPDHGEHFGKHGLTDHTMTVQQEVVGVPLVISYPSRLPKGKARI